MAGNSEVFQEKMEAGISAAWDQDWELAIREFSAAVQENGEDVEAHIQLGLALLNDERLDDALKVFMRAHHLAEDDPVPLERGADVLERMGRLKEAAQQYITVAEIYRQQRDLNKAIDTWERATHLTHGLTSIHARLAQAYERIGDKRHALYQYLMVAYNFDRADETEKAINAVERALRLNRRHTDALNMLRALRSGGEVTLPEPPEEELEDEPEPPPSPHRPDVGAADPLGPIGEAMSVALVTLAAHVVETGALDAAGGDALQAMELQRQERIDEAIEAYLRAEPRLPHPALKLNLGALLYLNNQPGEAVKHLSEAMTDPGLSAGAMHATGHSYFQLGDHKKASRFLIQSLQAVDTKLAADQEEITELTEIYGSLLDSLEGSTDDTLEAVNKRFIGWLSGEDWKRRIPDTRRHLQEIVRNEGELAVVEFIKDSDSEELPAKVARIDKYIRQGLLTLAMDEAHDAVQISPTYLPVHVRMAEIMMREGRLRQAILKYNVIARTYLAREENDRAAAILAEVLEMAPLDISVRVNLIDLLEIENRHEEVLDQNIELAKTYHQLGNFDLARETYRKAERMAEEMEASVEKILVIKHSLADMDQIRLDTRRAIKTYEEIIEIVPTDERAFRMLVDLNYSLADQVDAIKYLDQLLGIYAKKKQISKIVQMLEELVGHYSSDTGLRSRLAAIYKQLGRKREAIEQLDALGELQLGAGMNTDAIQTIKQIIALAPDNLEEYQRLLEKLQEKQ